MEAEVDLLVVKVADADVEAEVVRRGVVAGGR